MNFRFQYVTVIDCEASSHLAEEKGFIISADKTEGLLPAQRDQFHPQKRIFISAFLHFPSPTPVDFRGGALPSSSFS